MAKDRVPELLEVQDWGDLRARTLDFATHRSGSTERGEDLAQAAIARVLGGVSRWDPDKDPDLHVYLMSVVNMLLSNARRLDKRTESYDHHADEDDATEYEDPTAVGQVRAAENDLYARRIALLRRRLEKDDDASRLFELALTGFDAPKDLCVETGWTMPRVTKARLRMHRHAEEVARELCGDDPARLREDDEHDEHDEENQ